MQETSTAALPLDLESLVIAGAINGVDVSPDGKRITFASSEGGRSRVYVQALDDPSSRRLLQTGDQAATQPRWSPDGNLIAYLEDVGGDENYRVCVIGPDGGEIRDLTNRPGKLHENHSWAWDSSRIAYVSNRDGQFDVYYSDVKTGEAHQVTYHPSIHHTPEFSPDGVEISYASNRTSMKRNWDTFVCRLSDGRERKITQHEGEADEMSYYAGQRPLWSPSGKRVLVGSSVSGNYDILSIDPQSFGRDAIADSERDEINGQWSPDGSRVAYVINEDGNLVIHVKDLASGRSWPASHRHGSSGVIGMRGKGGDYRWTPDGQSIVYGYSGAAEAGSVWQVCVDGGDPICVYSSLPAAIDKSRLVSPQVVKFPSFDGLTISGLLYEASVDFAGGRGIVMPHGGPTGQSTNNWSALIQYLVSVGYTIFAPNFRGSTGYGRDFQWMNRNDWGGGDLKDVVAAADWLEAEGIARDIGIMGGSYGGFMTLSAVTRYPERWKAAVSIYGIANLETMHRTAREDMRHFQERNIGSPDENPEFYRERSPLNHVDNVRCPILILQGERDPRVTMREAEQMKASLERGNKTFELVVYEDEGHGFSKLENRLDYIRRIGTFFQRYLPAQGRLDG